MYGRRLSNVLLYKRVLSIIKNNNLVLHTLLKKFACWIFIETSYSFISLQSICQVNNGTS